MAARYEDLVTDLKFYLSRASRRSLVRPDWVSINLTLRCNLSCTMCTTCYPVANELTTLELKDLIDQVALWGVRILNPLGGEPFMREDLVEILDYACRKDFYITLTTNGTLISRRHAEGIAAIAYDRLHFNLSLDGPPEVHDAIRGKGTFAAAMNGYHLLRAADRAAGNPARKVLVNCLLHDQNLSLLPDFLTFCQDEGFQGIQLLTLFPQQNDGRMDRASTLRIPPTRFHELEELVERLKRLRERLDPLRFAIINSDHELSIMTSWYKGDLPPRRARCYAGWKELYINADGEAIVCDGHLDFLRGAYGNVRQKTLQQLWSSSALRRRREVIKACHRPCIQDCYLRPSSDSLLRIVGEATQRLTSQLKDHAPVPVQGVEVAHGTCLRLELSDVSDVSRKEEAPSTEPGGSSGSLERFQRFVSTSPVPFSRCYEDPFHFYELRNRGYLNFNRGFMGRELLQRFLPELERAGVKLATVLLGWRGDPLLHPELVLIYRDLLQRSKETGLFAELRTVTHGTLLNSELVDLALSFQSVRQTFVLELEAATSETYQRVYGVDLLPVVEARLAYLLAMKARLRATHLRVVLSFTVLEANEHEADAFVAHWIHRLKEQGLPTPGVALGRLPPWQEGGMDVIHLRREDTSNFLTQLAATERLKRVKTRLELEEGEVDLDTGRPPRCAAPFLTPTLSWDGKVTVCDQDRFLRLRVGEVTTQSLLDCWWRSESALEVRHAVKQGTLSHRDPCRDCRHPFSPNAPQLIPSPPKKNT